MWYYQKSLFIAVVLLGLSVWSIRTDAEEYTGPDSDFLTDQESDLLSPSVSSSFNFTVKKRLIWGREKNRVNIGYVGDGFAAADTNKFYQYSDSNIAYRRGLTSIRNNVMVMRPHLRYEKFCNYYQINLISPSSGIPGPLGGSTSGRLGTVNRNSTMSLFREGTRELGIDTIHWHAAILNNSGYNNSGGSIAVYSYPSWGDIACHEMGHTFHRFADEYYSSDGSSNTTECSEMNSTATIGSEKWSAWVGYKDIDPRTRSGGGQPTGDTVGYYPGSRYVQYGQYRPTSNSKMNMTGQTNPVSFNAPCREKIIHDIYAIVRPIDTMLSNTGTVTDPDSVWVQVIDPAVLKVDWYVDNVLKKPNGGTSISRSEITSVPGTFTVKAHVYDEAIRHMFSNNQNPDTLDIVRKDTARMVQDVQWTVNVTNVAIHRTALEKEAFSLSVAKNTVVYSLKRSGVVTFDLMGVNGTLVRSITAMGNEGRNSMRLFDKITPVSAGMYFLKMAAPGTTLIVPVTIQ
ncbi:MAG: hypothetical protein JW768_00750 [Chitinispirillaceae bacterium]|nr:hypothetical protein [Chitinispirillaceae bacterium]